MKQLVCEMCGGSDLVKQDGVFVCQNCGTKYSVEEARKMMVEGTVSVEGTVAVEGTVKVDKSEELKKLYTLARRAKDSDNTDNAVRYYTQIEMQDPDSWEAYFYLIYFKARVSKVDEIEKDCKNFTNCYQTVVQLILKAYGDSEESQEALEQVGKDIVDFSGIICATANELYTAYDDGMDKRELFIRAIQLIDDFGNCVIENTPYPNIAAGIWKNAIGVTSTMELRSIPTSSIYKFITKASGTSYDVKPNYILKDIAKKIYDVDPSYDDPYGVAKELRGKETFITCPKCGTKMREREAKCPKCGASKEEIQHLIKEQEERDAAERERIRKEREAKEAEEARLRAEKRAEWWATNKKKVIITIAIIVGVIIAIFAVEKIIDAAAEKKAVAEAYELIEQGDKLFATKKYNDALVLYDKARQKTNNSEVRNVLSQKQDELEKAKKAEDLIEAQKYEQQGDELFEQAQYEEAEKKYEAALAMVDEAPAIKQKQENSSECNSLLKKAQTAEDESRYSDAAKHYSDLYAIHSLAKYLSKANAMNQANIREQQRRKEASMIKAYAYYEEKDLTSFTIPNGVTTIGDHAFKRCWNLRSVTIPNSVRSIEESAFSGCHSLTSIDIPNSVISIGDWAFEDCGNLSSLTIGNGVTTIGKSAFRNCKYLQSVTIPNSVTRIGSDAFEGCTGLTSVTIPNSITRIESGAFGFCTGLTSVTIPNSVTSIGESAFMICTHLKSVTIPNSVTSIGKKAFYECWDLRSVTIPNSVTSIGEQAFDRCEKLNIKLPERFRGKVDLSDCKSVTYY